MGKVFQVVGVGHSCLDHICAIEEYPAEDGSTHITSISLQGGGAVATALVAVSRLGVSAGFVGIAGNDMISDEIVHLFAIDHVSTDFLVRRKEAVGLESFVMVNPHTGTRTKFPQRDCSQDILWNEGVCDAIRHAQVLHLDGTQYSNAVHAAQIAKKAGVTVSLDGCSMQQDNDKNKQLASMADILIMNKKYPLRVSGKDTYEDALLEIATWGPKTIICTLGERGCLAVVENKVKGFPAFTVPAIDTTGAGDVFHGAFLTGMLDGLSLEEDIRFASAVSAIKCMHAGGRSGIPTKAEALRFMNERLWP